jgi:hypothetical protein
MRKMIFIFVYLLLIGSINSQITPSPLKKEGDGPYSQLILRGVTVINGTGAQAFGPVDLVIEKNKVLLQNMFLNYGWHTASLLFVIHRQEMVWIGY